MTPIRITLLVALTTLLSGCFEYRNQICTDERLVDVIPLQGNKKVSFFTPEDMQVITVDFDITRVKYGTYSIENTAEFRTCTSSEGFLMAETKLPNGNFTSRRLATAHDGSITEMALVTGQDQLQENRIPYSIEHRNIESQFHPSIVEKVMSHPIYSAQLKEMEKVLVVDNQKSIFEELLSPVAIGLVYR